MRGTVADPPRADDEVERSTKILEAGAKLIPRGLSARRGELGAMRPIGGGEAGARDGDAPREGAVLPRCASVPAAEGRAEVRGRREAAALGDPGDGVVAVREQL